jgi:hypothetical protein
MEILRAIETSAGILFISGLLAYGGIKLWWRVWESYLLARMGVRLHKEFQQFAFVKALEEGAGNDLPRDGS